MNFLASVALAATLIQPPAGEYGTLKGQVILPAAPPAAAVDVNADKEHCLSKGPLVSDVVVVDPATKGLKNVIVWLRPDTTDRKELFPQDKIKPTLKAVPAVNHVVDQPCCQFIPRVLAVRVGDTVKFKNSSPVNHNINYNGDQAFNVNLPPNGQKVVPEPIAASNAITPFKCDIHPWMAGRMRVYDHPYFATTDDKGNFEIKDAPAGKWRLVVWHENGFHKGRDGILGMPVTLNGPLTELKPISFEFPK